MFYFLGKLAECKLKTVIKKKKKLPEDLVRGVCLVGKGLGLAGWRLAARVYVPKRTKGINEFKIQGFSRLFE